MINNVAIEIAFSSCRYSAVGNMVISFTCALYAMMFQNVNHVLIRATSLSEGCQRLIWIGEELWMGLDTINCVYNFSINFDFKLVVYKNELLRGN